MPGTEKRTGLTSVQRRASGYIVAVQEGTFRLMTDVGEVLLLTLAAGAGCGRDLQELCYSGARVMVDFECEPNRMSGVARAVRY